MGSNVTPRTSQIQLSPRRTVHLARLATAAGATLLLTACGGGTSEGTGPATATGDARIVTVVEKEFSIGLSETSFTPGTYTFQVENQGATSHDLIIKGPGVDRAASPAIDGGDTTELTVTLLPGTYQVWCSVGDHRSKGMDTTITVS